MSDIPLTEPQARNVSAPPRVESKRGRFVVKREAPETSYSLDPGVILSSVSAETPMDQSARFADLRERERVERLIERFAHRTSRRF